MNGVDIVADAEAEMWGLINDPTTREQGIRLATVLNEISKDQREIENLTVTDFACENYDVDSVWSLLNEEGVNAWRLKIFSWDATGGRLPLDYRVIYAPDPKRKMIQVLAIMHRDKNYEQDKEFIQEVIRRYAELGIPLLPHA